MCYATNSALAQLCEKKDIFLTRYYRRALELLPRLWDALNIFLPDS